MAWMYKHILTICFFLVMCYLTVKVVPIHGEETAPHSQSQLEPKPNCHSSGPIIGSHKLKRACSPNANPKKTPPSAKLVNKNQARVGSINKKQNLHQYDNTLSDPNADYGLFTVNISLGTPQQYYSLIVDTGSRWTWLRCRFCRQGCTSEDPPYDPTKSTCKHTITFPFKAFYDDNSFAKGVWGCDTLIIDDFGSIMNFQFGCGLDIYDGDNFANAAGILGLGRGDSSFVSQAGASIQVFSYFIPENGDGADLQFGEKARAKANTCTNQVTPMVRGYDFEKYYIDLVGINVDGNEISVPSTEFIYGRTIIDSGTVITRLPEAVYSVFRDAIRQSMLSYTLVDGVDELMDTCYSLEGVESIVFPEITFHFGEENTIDVILYKEGTIWKKNNDAVNCLAFAATEGYKNNIIGIVQQRGFNVLYDLERETIGFGTNCA